MRHPKYLRACDPSQRGGTPGRRAALLVAAATAALSVSAALASDVTSTWVNNANGQTFNAPDFNGDGHPDFSWTWPDNDNWSQQFVQGVYQYSSNPNQYYYYTLQPSNWSTDYYPNNGNGGVNYAVVIGSAGSPCVLDTSATIDTLDVQSGGTLNFNTNTSLTIAGGSLVNDGAIVINANVGGYGTSLNFSASGTLSGAGALYLNVAGTGAQITTSPGAILTQAAGHRIYGTGQITAAMVNHGLINASVAGSTLDLIGSDKSNDYYIAASSGGILNISGITINNAGGTVEAVGSFIPSQPNAVLNIRNNAHIIGGTLTSNSGSALYVDTGGARMTDITLSSGSTLNVHTNNTLTLDGTSVANYGKLVVNDNSGGYGTALNIDSNLALTGNGEVLLNVDGGAAQLNSSTGFALTNLGNLIHGHGQINAALTNNSLISADVGGGFLDLQSNDKTNNSTISAINAATLRINAITINQASTAQLLANGGSIELHNGTISHGLLNTANGGVFLSVSGYSNTLDAVTSNGTMNVATNSTLNVTGGSLVNNGVITVDSDSGGYATALNFASDTSLSGTGSVLMNNGGGAAQVNTAAGATVTQAASHTIHGRGQINAMLVNHGLVSADVAGQELTLLSNPKTNDGTLQATGGAVLRIAAIPIENGGGTIRADNATVALNSGASIAHGTLTSTSGGSFVVDSGNANLADLTLSAGTSYQIRTNTSTTVTGSTLTNNGVISVDSDNGGYGTSLLFNANVTLTGTGSVDLVHDGPASQLNTGTIPSTTTSYTLTQAAGHTIHGNGQLNAQLVNEGVVVADGGRTLALLAQPKENDNLFRATNSSTLEINSITVAQSASGLIAADGGGNVRLINATISGGTLATAAGSSFYTVSGTGSTLTGAVTNNAVIDVPTNSTLTVNAPSITNNGSIVVDSDLGGYGTALVFPQSSTVSGTGSIVLAHNGGAAQLNTASGATLTIAPTQSVHGQGQINAALVNQGTIASDSGGTIDLLGNPKSNTGTITAAPNSFVNISGVALNNSGGTLLAQGTPGPGNDSTIYLNSGATITGGTLTSTAEAQFDVNSGNATVADVTLSGGSRLNVPTNTSLNLAGSTLTNNGTIVVDSDGGGYATSLNASTNVTLAGTGTITLNHPSAAYLTASAGVTITNSTQTIDGTGTISAPMVNSGTVLADVAGQPLQITGPFVNHGWVKSTTGYFTFSSSPFSNDGTVDLATSASIPNATSVSAGTLSQGAWILHSPASLTMSGGSISGIGAAASVTLDGPNASFAQLSALASNAGSLTLTRGKVFSTSGDLTNSGTITLGPSARLQVTGSFTNTGVLDVSGGSLLLDSALPGALLSQLVAGYHNGAWDGANVRSTAAGSDPAHLTAIGYLSSPTSSQLKYTYYGDANLDGRVTADDYALIDRGMAKHLSGWSNGDFNYDGVVNQQDYLLIDRSFILQGNPLSPEMLAQRESQFGAAYGAELLAAVPEPGMVSVMGLIAVLLPRRSRRRP